MITDNNVNDFDDSDSDMKVDNGNEMIMIVMAKAMVMIITKIRRNPTEWHPGKFPIKERVVSMTKLTSQTTMNSVLVSFYQYFIHVCLTGIRQSCCWWLCHWRWRWTSWKPKHISIGQFYLPNYVRWWKNSWQNICHDIFFPLQL